MQSMNFFSLSEQLQIEIRFACLQKVILFLLFCSRNTQWNRSRQLVVVDMYNHNAEEKSYVEHVLVVILCPR